MKLGYPEAIGRAEALIEEAQKQAVRVEEFLTLGMMGDAFGALELLQRHLTAGVEALKAPFTE
jgi:hypothetical protein